MTSWLAHRSRRLWSPDLSKSKRIRADRLLVERGLAASTDQAKRLILAGRVSSGGRRVEKPGGLLDAGCALHVRRPPRYVSRGGDKLAGAIEALHVRVAGRCCLDAGASTGGFTDCLLQHGASAVHAVDVGYGTLAWKLRRDPRVIVHERTNIRAVSRSELSPPPDLVVADLAFVSLRSVLPVLRNLCGDEGELLLLVKPQFELEREVVEGGVVRDREEQDRAVRLVAQAAGDYGLNLLGRNESPLLGPRGNREFFVHLRAGRASNPEPC